MILLSIAASAPIIVGMRKTDFVLETDLQQHLQSNMVFKNGPFPFLMVRVLFSVSPIFCHRESISQTLPHSVRLAWSKIDHWSTLAIVQNEVSLFNYY